MYLRFVVVVVSHIQRIGCQPEAGGKDGALLQPFSRESESELYTVP